MSTLESRIDGLLTEARRDPKKYDERTLLMLAARIGMAYERAAVVSFLCHEDSPDDIVARYATPIANGAHIPYDGEVIA